MFADKIAKSSIELLFLFIQTVFPQKYNNSISGNIINGETNEPLPNVNIFISETFWGTSSNSNGEFRLDNLPPGQHKVVSSIIGFKVKTTYLKLKQNQNILITIKLYPKQYKLDEINITADKPVDWLDNLEQFKDLFLGRNRFATECLIQNPEIIEFVRDTSNNLFASAESPIVVINMALGFKIECILIDFQWDPNERLVHYNIAPRFYLMDNEDYDEISKWERYRGIAYLGSIQHLINSVINDNYEDEGFEL